MTQPAAAKTRLRQFDVADVRADFPILSRKANGKPLVYFDNAASAQKPKAVIDAMKVFMESSYANVHRGLHTLSNLATDAYEAAREKVRHFINAPSAHQVIFTGGGTDAFNLVANSLGQSIRPGDEIILSEMEHHSNIVPWHFHRERRGAVLKWAPISDSGEFLIDEFERLLTKRTRMVALTHMSNVLGTVVPMKKVIEIAHARGIPVLVDGSQAAVHMAVDVQDLGADFYVFTGHKVYGPSGIGVLYGKREHLEAMPPYQGGGEMISAVTFEKTFYKGLPAKFEAGTPNIAGFVGLGAALDYVEAVGRARIGAYERELLAYATAALQSVPGLRLIGEAPDKAAVLSFLVAGAHAHDLATLLDHEGVAVRSGHHCAHPLMQFYGVPATVRASLAFYNTREEVDRFVVALEKVRTLLA